MRAAHLDFCTDGTLLLSGDIDLLSVLPLWQDATRHFRERFPVRVDLAQVGRCDSAGVALLVEWLRQAQARGLSLTFVNIPAQMRAIIQVADLEDVLPIA